MRLAARDSSDPLHEVENALVRAAFLDQHGLDDSGDLGAGEAAFAQEVLPVLIGAHDELLCAARMPSTYGAGENSAKRVSAGAALWAKRVTYFEWRIVIS